MGEPISILRRKQVESRTGLSRSTIYDRIKRGAFPTPISLGAKAVGWIEAGTQFGRRERSFRADQFLEILS